MLQLELRDTEWPFEGLDHDRQIARAVVFNGAGRFYFVRAERDDLFGRATLIETSGGGIEPGESPEEAVRRELREELGAQVDVLCELALVSDAYNLIRRHNLNHYFLCRLRAMGGRSLTQDERDSFHLRPLCLGYGEAIREYARCSDSRLGRLIAQRELPVLRHAGELLSERGIIQI